MLCVRALTPDARVICNTAIVVFFATIFPFSVFPEELDKSYLNVTYDLNTTDSKVSIPTISHVTKAKLESEGTNVATPFINKLPNPLNPPVVDTRKGGPVGRPTTPKPTVVVTEEDKKVRKDWGGNCTTYHWEICSNQTTFGRDVYDEKTKEKIASQMSCADPKLFPPVCLFNGWTVSRCHLLCMSKMCNRDLKINYDKYVSKDGFC